MRLSLASEQVSECAVQDSRRDESRGRPGQEYTVQRATATKPEAALCGERNACTRQEENHSSADGVGGPGEARVLPAHGGEMSSHNAHRLPDALFQPVTTPAQVRDAV